MMHTELSAGLLRTNDWPWWPVYLGCPADPTDTRHFRRSTGTWMGRRELLRPRLRDDDGAWNGDGSEGHWHGDLIYCPATRSYTSLPRCPIYYSGFRCCDSYYCCCCCGVTRPLISLQETEGKGIDKKGGQFNFHSGVRCEDFAKVPVALSTLQFTGKLSSRTCGQKKKDDGKNWRAKNPQ